MCHSLAFSQSSLSEKSTVRTGTGLCSISDAIWQIFSANWAYHEKHLRLPRSADGAWPSVLRNWRFAELVIMENMCLRCVFCSGRMKLNVWLSFLFFSGLSWSPALCDTISKSKRFRVLVGLFKPSVQGYFGRLHNLKGTVPNSTRNNSQSMLQEVFFRKPVSVWAEFWS